MLTFPKRYHQVVRFAGSSKDAASVNIQLQCLFHLISHKPAAESILLNRMFWMNGMACRSDLKFETGFS